MQNTMHRSFFVAALVGGALLSACGDVVDAAASEPEGSSAVEAIDLDVLAAARELRDLERTKPEAPVRLTSELPRSRDPLPDVDPVAYSDAAGAWRRRLYLPGEEPAEKVQTFARSAERFYLADRTGADVWIFERNPVAPLQGSGGASSASASASATSPPPANTAAWSALIARRASPSAATATARATSRHSSTPPPRTPAASAARCAARSSSGT